MDNSESQFNELLANLVARINKMLSKKSEMMPIGLLLRDIDKIEILIAVQEDEWTLGETVQNLQDGMIETVRNKPATAGCIAYPDYENEEVIVYIENDEHYCAKYRIPVSGQPSLHLDVERIEVEDGEIFIFGGTEE